MKKNQRFPDAILLAIWPLKVSSNMGSENWNFLKLLKTMIVGALWFRLGFLSIRILCFFGGVICETPHFYDTFFNQGCFWQVIVGIYEEKFLDIPIQELFHQKGLDFN